MKQFVKIFEYFNLNPYSMLTFGGLVFWAVIAVLFLIIAYCIETEGEAEIGWATAWFVGGCVGLFLYWKNDMLQFFKNTNWTLFGVGVGVYLVVGILWLLFKWRKFSKTKYQEYLKEFQRCKDRNYDLPKMDYYIPLVKEHPVEINSWILFWPFSIVRYITQNMLTDFIAWIRDQISGTLNKISKGQFKPVE